MTDASPTPGFVAACAVVAASPAVATTFFGASGFRAVIGLGGAAATPVGWVVLAAVSGGARFGLSRALPGAGEGRVTVIPQFINTPLDVLGLGLFELMPPLALKVAAVDGPIDER